MKLISNNKWIRPKPIFFYIGWLILLLFSIWLMFYTFSYDSTKQSMVIAAKVWSDFGAHIPLIRSFSLGSNFPNVEYPIFPGEPIRYHFLFYLFVGSLERLGIRIDFALNIPSIAGFFFLLIMIYAVATELFHDRRVGALAIIFFLFNGSFAFFQFFETHPLSIHTLSDIVTNKDFPAFAPWDGKDILAFWNMNIYTNQRHFAAALGIALLYIFMFLRFEQKSMKHKHVIAIVLGLLAGILPFFHQPTLPLVATIMIFYVLLFPKARRYIFISGITAFLVVIPQLLLLPKSTNGIEWYPGFYVHRDFSILRFISYWIQNIGLHIIFIILGFIIAPRRAKKALIIVFVLFTVANLFKFSKELAASHKFFNFALILGQMASSYFIISYINKLKKIPSRLLRIPLYGYISIMLFLLTFSGIIDFFAVANDNRLPLADIGTNKTATWIATNTPSDAIILNSSYLFNPASIAGRKIFLGWPYFAWSAGHNTETRMEDMRIIYEVKNTETMCQMLRQYNIDYITVEPTNGNPDLPDIDILYFSRTYTPIFTNDSTQLTIYSTNNICTSTQ
ncbi:hypothetical protein ACFL1P_01630 [Patescibacteria group bacterium]